ncbi:membrane protein [Candidatus Francisella endociliophora]|uniref:Membrane protein n=1 Tax=Candidatus Francisella endociliophora TaxID=653937 RepID=A0A097EMC4_9GAMM|nr:LysO family transporter [Francisella sp. FSC1006]AIT08715.1 membrane protein [Francisella sp. FSC1006]
MYESIALFICLLMGYYIFNFNKSTQTIKYINTALELIVVLIIFLLGYNFSIFTHTNTIVFDVISTSLLYSCILFIANILGVCLYCYYKSQLKSKFVSIGSSSQTQNIFLLVLQASKYLTYLIIGYILGEIINIDMTHFIDNVVLALLFGLMFIIGILLRLENIPIKDLFKNKVAITIVIIIVITSISSAILISLITNIPLKESIMICSGFGWYSLSVVLNTGFIGEYYGMVTFMVDFLREIIVIATVPLLKRYLSIELVGYAANTAMDFCLPVIKNNYGTKIVPLAIAVGLIFTILTPGILVLENLIL